LFTCVCGFIVVLTILNRILKIYMIAPFAGLALSTLAAGGQTAQVGYSYIKTFFGYVLTALLIAVVITVSSTFIDTVALDSQNALVRLLEYCLKMGAVASSVKMSDSVMQKAFGL
jgi:type IV secretory pathway TrbL component